MVSGSHEESRLFDHVLEHYVVHNFSILCAARIFFNQHNNTINKGPLPTTEMHINNTISFLHRVNADMEANDDDFTQSTGTVA